MQISIAMATYNGEKYLGAQLQSFLDQTRHPNELVVTDDCSTDSTMSILTEFANAAPFPVKVSQNQQNLGYAGNFNAALTQTTGDLVFLSDQDDVWFPHKLESIEQQALSNPEKLIVLNDARLTDADLNDTGLTKLGQIYAAGYSDRQFVMGCCCAVRRELLELCLPIPYKHKTHDLWINRFADLYHGRHIVPQPMQHYRRHGSNESQFVANQTVKLTRAEAVRQKANSVPPVSKHQKFQNQLGELQLFQQYLSKAIASYSATVDSALQRQTTVVLSSIEREITEAEQNIELEESREIARRKPPGSRVVAVLRLLASGRYRRAAGVMSALRDLRGHQNSLGQ